MPRLMRARRTMPLVIVGVTCLALGACGSDEEGPSVLSQEQATTALLTQDDVGANMNQVSGDAADKSQRSLGCLDSLRDMASYDDEAQTRSDIKFEVNYQNASNGVFSFADEQTPRKVMSDFRKAVDGCQEVNTPFEGGTLELAVIVDETLVAEGADEQVNVTAIGSLVGANRLPVVAEVSLARIANNIAGVVTFELSEGGSWQYDLTNTAVARLNAVMNGGPMPPPAPAADGSRALRLTEGSSLTLKGETDDAAGVPLNVVFDSLTCDTTLPGMGMDESYDISDFVAGEGDQACLVSLAVMNTGTQPSWFYSGGVTMLTRQGKNYGETGQPYSAGDIANQEGEEYAGDNSHINPDKTDYDYLIFEIPADATPEALIFSEEVQWIVATPSE